MPSRPSLATLALAALAAAGCASGRAATGVARQAGPEAAPPVNVRIELVEGAAAPTTARRIRAALPAAVAAAARWGRLPDPTKIVLHRDQAALQAAAGLGAEGATLAWARDSLVDLVAPDAWPGGPGSALEVSLILAHELTHLVLYREAGPGGRWAALGIPSWFREGMATVTAGERHPRPRAGALGPGARPAALQAGAHHAFLLLRARHGEAGVRRLVARLGEGAAFPEAFAGALGSPLPRFEAELAALDLVPRPAPE